VIWDRNGHPSWVHVQNPDPWPDPASTVAEAVDLGVRPDPDAVAILGTKWLALYGLPVMTGAWGGRLLLLGSTESAMFATDFHRRHLVQVLWSGSTSELRWRRPRGWLVRVEAPTGHKFYADARAERQRLEAAAPR
jgi:hypothetical protein